MESRSKQDMQATRNTAERGEARQRRKITQADLTPEEKRLLYEDPDVEIYPALFVPGYASPAFYSRVFRNRLEDAKRAIARAWELEPAPHVAGRVAAIARRQGRADEAETWDRRAGAAVPVDQAPPPP